MGRPFQRGVSGNPRGRPKGFGKKIREMTGGGVEMVELALKIMRGEITETRQSSKGEPFEVTPSCRERMDAVKWLADRGWGKVPDAEDDDDTEAEEPPAPESLDDVEAKVLSLTRGR